MIVITTVTPKPGKINVSYSLTGEVEMPDLSDYNLLNAADKLEAERISGCFEDPTGGVDTENRYRVSIIKNCIMFLMALIHIG
mgnify:CR=1 FL=1